MAEADGYQDPATHREAFKQLFGGDIKGSFERRNEDGSLSTIRAYEVLVNAMTDRSLLIEFGLRAAAAGYKQAIGPIVLQNVGFMDQHGTLPQTSVQFFLEETQPSIRQETEQPPLV
ncbi:hypothetical protein HY024_02885 [Candidatus Curtissbacteria bacterium]|nr:hypothetical protein [Candidatus Curtissbacteria bacterium]